MYNALLNRSICCEAFPEDKNAHCCCTIKNKIQDPVLKSTFLVGLRVPNENVFYVSADAMTCSESLIPVERQGNMTNFMDQTGQTQMTFGSL